MASSRKRPRSNDVRKSTAAYDDDDDEGLVGESGKTGWTASYPSSTDPVTCALCSKTLKCRSGRDLRDHALSHGGATWDTAFRCLLCQYHSHSRRSVSKHVTSAHLVPDGVVCPPGNLMENQTLQRLPELMNLIKRCFPNAQISRHSRMDESDDPAGDEDAVGPAAHLDALPVETESDYDHGGDNGLDSSQSDNKPGSDLPSSWEGWTLVESDEEAQTSQFDQGLLEADIAEPAVTSGTSNPATLRNKLKYTRQYLDDRSAKRIKIDPLVLTEATALIDRLLHFVPAEIAKQIIDERTAERLGKSVISNADMWSSAEWIDDANHPNHIDARLLSCHLCDATFKGQEHLARHLLDQHANQTTAVYSPFKHRTFKTLQQRSCSPSTGSKTAQTNGTNGDSGSSNTAVRSTALSRKPPLGHLRGILRM